MGAILLDYLGGSSIITGFLLRGRQGGSEERWAGKQSHSDVSQEPRNTGSLKRLEMARPSPPDPPDEHSSADPV